MSYCVINGYLQAFPCRISDVNRHLLALEYGVDSTRVFDAWPDYDRSNVGPRLKTVIDNFSLG
jgi:hypothetical protein